jgi:manganese/zinc/iron transport system permease protein
MILARLEILLIACVVASACVLPGVFLVLRRVALMSDAISHAILLGIVVAFFMVQDLNSPILIVAAAATGLLTVSLTELIIQSGRLQKDAAIGLVFPVFFSIGVILINLYAGNVHIDNDMVLLGELAFAPFNRLVVNGLDLGPMGLWVMGTILMLNAAFIAVFYKELKLSTFDPALAGALGFSPALIHYLLMAVVSITAVGAFDVVGSILVVALMITPPAAAYLWTHRLSRMIALSIAIGIASAIGGYGMAIALNVSIAGSMACMTGVAFLISLVFSTQNGLLTRYFRFQNQRVSFAAKILLVQLLDHEGTSQEETENTVSHMERHMEWAAGFSRRVTAYAVDQGLMTHSQDRLFLTPLGRETARQAMQMG